MQHLSLIVDLVSKKHEEIEVKLRSTSYKINKLIENREYIINRTTFLTIKIKRLII